MMTDLDELLSSFAQRKKAELAVAPPKEVAAAQLRAISQQALQMRITPILQDLATSVRANGHDASVKESLNNTAFPSVLFSFTPTLPILSAAIAPSIIRFAHTASGALEMSQVIGCKSRRQARPNIAILPTDISEDLIRSQVFQFVDAVLQVN